MFIREDFALNNHNVRLGSLNVPHSQTSCWKKKIYFCDNCKSILLIPFCVYRKISIERGHLLNRSQYFERLL